jgi:hypothetical protein
MPQYIELKATPYVDFEELYSFDKAKPILDLLKDKTSGYFPSEGLSLALVHRVRFIHALRDAIQRTRLDEYADLLQPFLDWFDERVQPGVLISVPRH